jgi:hypothetical protein
VVDSAQDLDSGFWLSRQGQFHFKKNQNDGVLVKKNKNQRVATGFLTGSCRVTLGFDFLCFFLNPARLQPRVGRVTPGSDFLCFFLTRPNSSPGSAGSQVDLSSRVGFQNYTINKSIWENIIQHKKSNTYGN